MAYIESGVLPHAVNRALLAGEIPIMAGGGGTSFGGVSQTNPTGGAEASFGSSDSVMPEPGMQGALFDKSAGSTGAGLLNPLTEQAQMTSARIRDLGAQFREQAGPSRTFEGIGGADVLQQAIQPGADEAAINAGKSLVAATYAGPGGFDPTASMALGTDAARLQDLGSILRTGSGIQSVLRESHPQLTPGEARYSAAQVAGDQGYREGAAKAEKEAQGVFSQYNQERQGALDYAKQRSEEERSIAQQSQGYLTGKAKELSGTWETRSKEAEAENKRIADLMEAIRRGEAPESIPGFENPLTERKQAAIDTLNKIWGKYADIKDLPMLTRTKEVSDPNTMRLVWPEGKPWPAGRGYGPMNYYEAPKNLSDEQVKRLVERQQELEGFFAPFATGDMFKYQSDPYKDSSGFAQYLPMYFGEDYVPGSLEPYVQLKPGTDTNPQRFTTGDERQTFNRIQELLGNAQRVGETDPFIAAQLIVDAQAYLNNERNNLLGSSERADEQYKQYLNGLRKAEKDISKYLRDNPSIRSAAAVIGSQPRTYGGIEGRNTLYAGVQR